MFINIHSHNKRGINEWCITNLYRDFEETKKQGHYSIGLHPWYIDEENWQRDIKALETYSNLETVLAIGECGLDKICKTDLSLQEEVFVRQIKLSNEINKPLIIHCVRAHEEILQLLKKQLNKVPVIFHGFNKHIILAEKILAAGHWLSFGTSLLHKDMQSAFATIPPDKIFLETDDALISIENIYKTAAEIKKISIEELSSQLNKNLFNVFNITI